MENNDNEKSFDNLAKKPAFYVLIGACLLAVILTVVFSIIAALKKPNVDIGDKLETVGNGNYDGDDYLKLKKNFEAHEYYVQNPENAEATPSESMQIVTSVPNNTVEPLPTESPRIIIENSADVDTEELEEILKEKVSVLISEKLDWPRVVLFSTYAGECYATSAAERKINVDISGYDKPNSITRRAEILEKASEAKGVGVALRTDICDKILGKEYETSSNLAKTVADACTTCELSIDLQRAAFEHPEGQKYAQTVTKDGKAYATVKFVVSVSPESRNWKDNLRFVSLYMEKLNEKVPGIAHELSITPDAKYNTDATRFGILIELGYEGNYVSEADATAAVLGDVLADIYLGS